MSLVAKLTHPNPNVREVALGLVSVKHEPTDEELCALAELLRDDSEHLRELAAAALQGGAMVYWPTERVVSVLPAELLLPALGDRSSDVRENVLWVLQHYPTDDRIRSVATDLLRDPVCLVRIRAAAVLWAQTRDQALIRPVVDEAIRSGDRDSMVSGCHLLTQFGAGVGDVVALVWDALRHPDATVRGNAGYALFKCCADKRVLAEGATLLEASFADSPEPDAMLQYAAHKLRKASEDKTSS